jgi:hypothetical protein
MVADELPWKKGICANPRRLRKKIIKPTLPVAADVSVAFFCQKIADQTKANLIKSDVISKM